MPWQCGRSAALRSSRAGQRPALGHLRARSLPPGRTTTRSTTKTTTATRTTRATRTRPPRAAAKEGKQLQLRRRRRGPRRHRRRGDRKGSAISETPRSGPEGVKDARSARPAGPLLDARGPGRTGPGVAFGPDLVQGLRPLRGELRSPWTRPVPSAPSLLRGDAAASPR